LSPWRFVLVFGMVSLLADVVYEGARSITGPLLASLGASAALVGLVTGAGEAAALVLRLGSGALADRTGRFWGLTIAGYALTVVSVPLLGVAGALWVACALVIAERVGKAVRSPAKDTLLSHATSTLGRGRGFAVHEALDQVGALAGPLLVAAVLAGPGGYRGALLSLAAPGVLVLALLLWLRALVPRPAGYEFDEPAELDQPDEFDQPVEPGRAAASSVRPATAADDPAAARLPAQFWAYAAFTALTTSGFATFGVLAYHLATRHLVTLAAIPLVYAAAMGVDAIAALASGYAYDRYGRRVLVALPVLSAAVPPLAFAGAPALAIAGALVWGAAVGVQESTVRAAVADLVPPARRATGYGVFAAAYGGAAAVGGVLAGALYSRSVAALVAVTALIQAASLVLLARSRPRPHTP
jgi:MFS family permease